MRGARLDLQAISKRLESLCARISWHTGLDLGTLSRLSALPLPGPAVPREPRAGCDPQPGVKVLIRLCKHLFPGVDLLKLPVCSANRAGSSRAAKRCLCAAFQDGSPGTGTCQGPACRAGFVLDAQEDSESQNH